ncbi:OB-fold nucleic acid binding domain-containing protein [Novosphingobium gossypii]|uniref:OB-fold nucleic acid binding domain-containing protein n=1 Tax=Novosphingobium gossypii TaxID=1604774 RepID=UPI003D24DF31
MAQRAATRYANVANSRDGRRVEVAGIILVPEARFRFSQGRVLFITIEDETGTANGIFWPDRFGAQRRTVMSPSMVGLEGQVQKEGGVIHVICDKIIDLGYLLHHVGKMSFPHRAGSCEAPHSGAADRGDTGWNP